MGFECFPASVSTAQFPLFNFSQCIPVTNLADANEDDEIRKLFCCAGGVCSMEEPEASVLSGAAAEEDATLWAELERICGVPMEQRVSCAHTHTHTCSSAILIPLSFI